MTEDRDVEVTMDLPDFVAELRRLADALEAGEGFEMEIEGETVRAPAFAITSIEHEREDGRQELEFQLKWGAEEERDEDDSDDEDEEEEAGEEA